MAAPLFPPRSRLGSATASFAARAVDALDGALGLSQPGSTRILVIVSDGHYRGTQHADGQKLITRLAASGCLVIWIAPTDTASGGRPPPDSPVPSASVPRKERSHIRSRHRR